LLGQYQLNVHWVSIIPFLATRVQRENVVILVPHVQFKLIVLQKLTSDVNVIMDISVMLILVDVSLNLNVQTLLNVVRTNFGICVVAHAVRLNVPEAQ